MVRLVVIVLLTFFCICEGATAQTAAKGKSPKSAQSIKAASAAPAAKFKFTPTTTFAEGTVGSYFYPREAGSMWTTRTISRYFAENNQLLHSDTMFTEERVLPKMTQTIQNMPVLTTELRSYKAGEKSKAQLDQAFYYVDDSVIMAVFNNSLSHSENRVLLVSPMKVGNRWREKADDTVRTTIVSLEEPLTVEGFNWGKAVVTVTKLGLGELAKYFVPNAGIVKTVFRGPGPKGRGATVITSEIVELRNGQPAGEQVSTPNSQSSPALQQRNAN